MMMSVYFTVCNLTHSLSNAQVDNTIWPWFKMYSVAILPTLLAPVVTFKHTLFHGERVKSVCRAMNRQSWSQTQNGFKGGSGFSVGTFTLIWLLGYRAFVVLPAEKQTWSLHRSSCPATVLKNTVISHYELH